MTRQYYRALPALLIAAAAPFLAEAASAQAPLISRVAASRCMAVNGGDRQVTIEQCNGSAGQQFTLDRNGQIRSGDGLCLDASQAMRPPWEPRRVVGYACDPGKGHQKWSRAANGQIRGYTNECIEVHQAKSGTGSGLILWPCGTAGHQVWDVGAVAAAQPAPQPTPQPAPVDPVRGFLSGVGGALNALAGAIANATNGGGQSPSQAIAFGGALTTVAPVASNLQQAAGLQAGAALQQGAGFSIQAATELSGANAELATAMAEMKRMADGRSADADAMIDQMFRMVRSLQRASGALGQPVNLPPTPPAPAIRDFADRSHAALNAVRIARGENVRLHSRPPRPQPGRRTGAPAPPPAFKPQVVQAALPAAVAALQHAVEFTGKHPVRYRDNLSQELAPVLVRLQQAGAELDATVRDGQVTDGNAYLGALSRVEGALNTARGALSLGQVRGAPACRRYSPACNRRG